MAVSFKDIEDKLSKEDRILLFSDEITYKKGHAFEDFLYDYIEFFGYPEFTNILNTARLTGKYGAKLGEAVLNKLKNGKDFSIKILSQVMIILDEIEKKYDSRTAGLMHAKIAQLIFDHGPKENFLWAWQFLKNAIRLHSHLKKSLAYSAVEEIIHEISNKSANLFQTPELAGKFIEILGKYDNNKLRSSL